MSSPPVFLMGTVRVLLIVLFFCVVLLCVFTFRGRIKTMLGSALPTIVIRKVHVLFTLLVFVAYTGSGVQHILCCVFVLSFMVLCTL